MAATRKARVATKTYDAEADVMYVSIGGPRRAIGREPQEDIVLRLDPQTEELVGLTILHWQERFGGSMEAVREALQHLLPEEQMELVPA